MLTELLSQVVGQASQRLHVPEHPAVSEAMRFLGALQSYMFGPWLATAKLGHKCVLVAGCDAAAIAPCLKCHRPVCPRHALVSASGEVVCKACALGEQAPRAKREPSNGGVRGSSAEYAETMMRHLSTLGLEPGATLEQVKKAYRSQARRYHPDRAAAGFQELYERKLREINAAKDWLEKNLR